MMTKAIEIYIDHKSSYAWLAFATKTLAYFNARPGESLPASSHLCSSSWPAIRRPIAVEVSISGFLIKISERLPCPMYYLLHYFV